MALEQNGIFSQSQKLREITNSPATSDVAFQLTCDNAMNAAVSSGLYTTTASTTGITPLNVQSVMYILKQSGYTVSLASTTLTISW